MSIYDVQVTKHLADDKKNTYVVTLQGQAIGLSSDITEVTLIFTTQSEEILKSFPRGKIFSVKIASGNQTTLEGKK